MAQPLNNTISIYYRLRGEREASRHDTIKNIIGDLKALTLIVPGQEVRTEVVARDTTVSDMSPYMGQAAAGATRGMPVVVGVQQLKDFSLIQNLTGVDFPVVVGRDKLVQYDSDHVSEDLYGNARDLS